MEERLQKILARAGLASRRSSEEFIVQGRVTVNGKVAVLGQKADLAVDRVAVDGQPLAAPEKLTYVLLHKPRGVVSSLAPQGDRQTVRAMLPLPERLYPVGRLDVDSEGLILMTNDGELAEFLTHPRYEAEKEYRVLVKGEPDAERLEAWRRGVVLEGVRTAPAQVARGERAPTGTWLRIVMHEGRKHQIRDIGMLLGLPVQRLIRVRLGSLRLGNLAPGEWRRLTADEVAQLRAIGQKPAPKPPSRVRARPRPANGTPEKPAGRAAAKRTPAAGRDRRPASGGQSRRPAANSKRAK
jgi:23S rRNA pseudouridine2605 synthase